MACPTRPGKTPPIEILQKVGLFLFCAGLSRGQEFQEWVLIRTADGTVLATNTSWNPKGSTSITLTTDFSKLFGENLRDSPISRVIGSTNLYSGAGKVSGGAPFEPLVRNEEEFLNKQLILTEAYGCPEPPGKSNKRCGNFGDYYCRNWGCETLVTKGEWTPGGGADKHISVRRTGSYPRKGRSNQCAENNCNPTTIIVHTAQDSEWTKGRTWGVRLYVSGSDPGTFFTIRKLPTKGRPLLRGKGNGLPSRVSRPIWETPGPPEPKVTKQPNESTDFSKIPPAGSPVDKEDATRAPFHTQNPLLNEIHHQGESALNLLDKVFLFLNSSQPETTESCWLCLNPRAPYYVGIGANTTKGGSNTPAEIHVTSASSSCFTDSTLTLEQFHGKGTCYLLAGFNLTTSNYGNYCLTQEILPTAADGQTPSVIQAAEGTWFICTAGISKCIMPTTPEFCVSAFIIPQVYLYGGDPDFLLRSTGKGPRRVKRAPLLIPIIATIGIVGSAAMGAGALVHGDSSLRKLSQEFSKDISLLQDQVAYLEKQVDSLAEVALQNRRGLDLLFLQQGGLCVALGEDCCLYANHSGVIRESIKTLTTRLREREQVSDSTNWFASLFQSSPWLTTLVSAITGPLLLLILLLTIGPVIINKLLSFIRDRIDTVKLMVLSQPYIKLPQTDWSRV